MDVCPTCRRPLPEAADVFADLIVALGELPNGATATVVAKRVRRRRVDVQAALEGLAAAGFVECVEVRGRRGWPAKTWRLRQKPSGQEWDSEDSGCDALRGL